ncbi:MAG: FAD-binding protein, partial [Actinomycetes bacterium]
AAAMDVPADALAGTVRRFNDFARAGRDTDFGRGDSAYDRYYGDPTLANPCLDVMDTGPYYAIRVVAGDLGTKGGVVCDEHGRALRPEGSVIPGLYATGNASASVMGNEYAGAGATIGPAIAYGYVAARHAAQERSAAAEPSPS